MFEGNTGDPATLATQIDKLKQRFDLAHVVLVGDRGMITQARIDQDLKPAGLDWITALRAPQIRALVDAGALQLSLFDERDLASITAPDYPGERLIVCRNPDLARDRAPQARGSARRHRARSGGNRRRPSARQRQPLRGTAEIGLKVGAVLDRHKMAKHFDLTITDAASASPARPTRSPPRRRSTASTWSAPACAAALDDDADGARLQEPGPRRARLPLPQDRRSAGPPDLPLGRPRVRAHVFLCMLAYHVEWHMRARLAPMLYDDDRQGRRRRSRASIVAKAERSPAALAKQTTGAPPDGLPVHSFHSLLADLAAYARIDATTALNENYVFTLYSRPTPVQQRAFELLGVTPRAYPVKHSLPAAKACGINAIARSMRGSSD